ncbi:tryptophan--tRNA ligase [candidate division Kazan bacterium RBG_13_50_9]|uniref:Tryptophan--tRNA ligase n=1 Tax=candidate division Kazan bacterium RBG_13_50_9 TaxID=1798535 RepID=A0A1F4NTT5_UNCK3|nr:MAG: tryptophan--tRNA ligase [candidate division Kazan bacterium RBG_13_50_9]
MKKTVLSGIQPSGVIHIGNYLGAISQWALYQNKYRNIFCVVDLHAITTPQDPKSLREKTYEVAAIYLAAGLDPKKSIIFVQSHVPAHSELAWIITTISKMGELSRMTQFKDKTTKLRRESIPTGLFIYPTLMAADILLYQANLVPVGEDQKQHVELARDLSQRFNQRFGKTFIVPEPLIRKSGARIMGLDNPEQKMSKSATREMNYIALTDKPATIRKKIIKAVTDSGTAVKFDPKRKGLHNLLTIYKLFSGQSETQIEQHFRGQGYGALKKDLAELIIKKLAPIQKKIAYYMQNKHLLDRILANGAKRADKIAQATLKEVKQKLGLVL